MTLPTVIGATATRSSASPASRRRSASPWAMRPAVGRSRVLLEQWNGSAWAVVTSCLRGATDLSAFPARTPPSARLSVARPAPPLSPASGTAPRGRVQTLSLPNGSRTVRSSARRARPRVLHGRRRRLRPTLPRFTDAYSWNGATWTASSACKRRPLLPLLRLVRRAVLLRRHGVRPGSGQPVTVWNGSTWSLAQNVPTPSAGGSLDGISCFSADELRCRRHERRGRRRRSP